MKRNREPCFNPRTKIQPHKVSLKKWRYMRGPAKNLKQLFRMVNKLKENMNIQLNKIKKMMHDK
jgi:hypothetical protein